MRCLSITSNMQHSTSLFVCVYIPKTYCSDWRAALTTSYGLEENSLIILCNSWIQWILLKQLVIANKDMLLKTKYTEAATGTATLSKSRLTITDTSICAVFWGTSDKLQVFHLLTAKGRKKKSLNYLFSHAFSLAPEPPPSRLLWHLFFDPRLNSSLKN